MNDIFFKILYWLKPIFKKPSIAIIAMLVLVCTLNGLGVGMGMAIGMSLYCLPKYATEALRILTDFTVKMSLLLINTLIFVINTFLSIRGKSTINYIDSNILLNTKEPDRHE